MKWFKHDTDAHTNLKLQRILDTLGMAGYGYYWTCLELIGVQGEEFRIKNEKNWKNYILKMTGLSIKDQDNYLSLFVQENLIDKKANKRGDLYIPKLAERADDYTKRVRRGYGQSTDSVHAEQKRTEEIRTDKKEKTSETDFIKNSRETLKDKWGTKK